MNGWMTVINYDNLDLLALFLANNFKRVIFVSAALAQSGPPRSWAMHP